MKTLLALIGPTGVGKTDLSLSLAQLLQSPILSADSRQIYREIPIGTAAPTAEQRALVPHYFVGTQSVAEPYNAGAYEADALALLNQLFESHDTLLLTGGSMLYVEAVCKGLDDIPKVSQEAFCSVQILYQNRGLTGLQTELKRFDPAYYAQVDLKNPQRLMHALAVSLTCGQPYSSFRKGQPTERPFRVVKVGLYRERAELYRRINERVVQMLEQGLEAEARAVLPYRTCNALQTVGYKEMFAYFDGAWSLERAVEMIQQNSRRYAKRQLTWFRHDASIHWFEASQVTPEDILNIL